MDIEVLGIAGSPRREGNSDLLLRKALARAEAGGATTHWVALRELNIAPCQECDACEQSGECRLDDDFSVILQQLLDCDRLIVASPVFFMTVTAHLKVLIERCQCLWARKYVLHQPLFPDGPRDRRAMLIAIGGTAGERMFDCAGFAVRYWLDVLEMKQDSNLFVNQVDAKGDILKHPTALQEAARLGELLVTRPQPHEPETVRLYDGISGANKGD